MQITLNAFPPYLVRSCSNEFNPLHCRTLKIGTLQYFRDIEDEHVVDREEGHYSIDIDFRNVHLPSNVYNYLLGTDQISSHGRFDQTWKMPSFLYENTSLYGMIKGEFTWKFRNRFILCFHGLSDPSESDIIFPQYNDKWFLKRRHVKDGLRILADEFFEYVKSLLSQGEDVFTVKTKCDYLNFVSKIVEVKYDERHKKITNIEYYSNNDSILKIHDLISFLKPKKYSSEREYRWIIDFYYNDKPLEPKVDYLILPCEKFSSYLNIL